MKLTGTDMRSNRIVVAVVNATYTGGNESIRSDASSKGVNRIHMDIYTNPIKEKTTSIAPNILSSFAYVSARTRIDGTSAGVTLKENGDERQENRSCTITSSSYIISERTKDMFHTTMSITAITKQDSSCPLETADLFVSSDGKNSFPFSDGLREQPSSKSDRVRPRPTDLIRSSPWFSTEEDDMFRTIFRRSLTSSSFRRFFDASGNLLPVMHHECAFDVFEIPRSFHLEEKALEKTYHALQRKLHPDKFFSANEDQQSLAKDQSTIVNDAYRELRSPYQRSKILLRLEGYDIEESYVPDSGLLMEVMNVREALEENKDREKIGVENQTKIDETVSRIANAFASADFEGALDETVRLRYLNTIRNEVYGLVD